jgi:hypothetical protein
MRAFHAWRDGLHRVASAPAVITIVWLATTLVAMPLTLMIRSDVLESLDRKLVAGAAAQGMNYEWMRDFDAHAMGLASTFRPTIVGFAAVLDNVSAFVDNVRRPSAIAAAAGIYVVVWTFLAGGVIDRYVTQRRTTNVREFVRACGQYFGRLLRLQIATVVTYGLLFAVVHRWIFGDVYPQLVRNVTLDRTAFFIRLTLYAIFVVLLAIVNLIVDFAKIRTVVERRRSVVMAVLASLRYIRSNAGAAAAVYLLDAAAFAVLMSVYASVAPAGGGMGATVWAAVLIGQAYVIGRLCVRLLFFASEAALFQSWNS